MRANLPVSGNIGTAMQRVLRIIHRFEDALLALVVAVMIFLAGSQILLRNLFDTGFAWADPMLRLLVLWVGLLGALAASRTDKHIAIDVFSRMLGPRALAGARSITTLFTAAVSGLIAYHAGRFVAMEREAGIVGVAGLSAWVLELIIPVGFGLIAVRYLVLFGLRVRAVFGARSPA